MNRSVIWLLIFSLIFQASCSSKAKQKASAGSVVKNLDSSMSALDYEYKLAFKEAGIQTNHEVECYVVLPGTGCHGCISTVESFLKENYAKSKSTKFILTKIESLKLLKLKLGIEPKHPNIILDTLNLFNKGKLESIYPAFIFMDVAGNITEVRHASPSDNGLARLIEKTKKIEINFSLTIMKKVVFICFQLESHLFPTLGPAKALSAKYKVIYAIPTIFKGFPILHNYDFISLEGYPFGYGHEKTRRIFAKQQVGYLQILQDRKNESLYKERHYRLTLLIKELDPTLVIVDLLCSTDIIILLELQNIYHFRIATFNTMLSTEYSKTIPHIGSSFSPRERFNTLVEYHLVSFYSKAGRLLENVKFLGNGNYPMIKRKLNQVSGNCRKTLYKNRTISHFFEGIPELIAAPLELEYPGHQPGPDQFYIGPLIDYQRAEKFHSQAFAEALANIKRLKTENINFRCVYCAFGSMHGAWNKRIRKFLYRLFDAVSGIDNLILVCAFTDHEGLLDTTKIPENVLMFDRVPQLRMLQLADLFITHGGLGSIKESIMAGVPMLAYPITNNWDSNGNCTKIAFHEFGLKGNIDRDSALHIIAKIYRIFNTTSFRKSLLSINDLVVRVYTDKRFVEHIDKLLAD